jgi:hypothetical protein
MATPKQVRAWIDQADADLVASRARSVGLGECHRRYWIQQSYEKSIKAFALMRWTGTAENETELARLFLLQHSPLKTVSQANAPLSKALHLLSREVDRQQAAQIGPPQSTPVSSPFCTPSLQLQAAPPPHTPGAQSPSGSVSASSSTQVPSSPALMQLWQSSWHGSSQQ